MKVIVFGRDGKVGASLIPRLEEAGHTVLGLEIGEAPDLGGYDAAIDFTSPSAVHGNMRRALDAS
ncbi:MAG: 4-hydroxy-tetrahydrodipicolinate reductase, partial [Gaiellaceae bacterium]